MGFNPVRRRPEEPSDRGRAKQKRNEGDVGSVSKILHMEKSSREVRVKQMVPELEVVPIPRKRMKKGNAEKRRGAWTTLHLMKKKRHTCWCGMLLEELWLK